MKLFEKAKVLGVKSAELIRYLNDTGEEIKSPNQELTDTQELTADNLISVPESKGFKAGDIFNVVGITEDNEVRLLKIRMVNTEIELLNVQDTKKFPSKAQAFAHVEYLMSKIEMGDFSV